MCMIALATEEKRRGSATVGAWGHLTITTGGLPTGSTNSTLIMSEPLIWPEASTVDRTISIFPTLRQQIAALSTLRQQSAARQDPVARQRFAVMSRP